MKKILSLLLCLSIVFSMAACSFSLAATETASETAAGDETVSGTVPDTSADDTPITLPDGFAVGWAREIINPKNGTGLGGYGTQKTRLSQRILDDLMLTCTAISDGENVIFLFSSDSGQVGGGIANKVAEIIEKNYGFPRQNVFVNATHSHSTPAMANSGAPGLPVYTKAYYEAANKLAGKALRDLESAEIYVGSGKTEGLNFVRRYVNTVTGQYAGKNFTYGSLSADTYAHETAADAEMQIIKFDRATKKDVVLCNWQCHPTSPGGADNTEVSSDFISTLRATVESEADALFSYHQGAAGNIAHSGAIAGDRDNSDYRKHGQNIAQTALSVLQGNMTKVASGKVQANKTTFHAEYRSEIQDGSMKKLYSNALSATVFSIGDVAFATLPVELHDTLGYRIKHESPFEMTFYCGYSNGASGYVPDSPAWNNGGYEVEQTHFKRGTGEELVSYLLSELNTLYPTRF